MSVIPLTRPISVVMTLVSFLSISSTPTNAAIMRSLDFLWLST
ncbi:MAG: hypothetical protein ACD_39C01013G0001, partial [uncultured bacterium]